MKRKNKLPEILLINLLFVILLPCTIAFFNLVTSHVSVTESFGAGLEVSLVIFYVLGMAIYAFSE